MNTKNRLVIGTRGSALARWQAEHVASQLRQQRADLEVVLEIIVTSGDRFTAGPVAEVGGKAVWVKEIEEALISGVVDLAVHSLKDVPSNLPEGLTLAAFPPRADARDALVSRAGYTLETLPHAARVGTSSLRRTCQLKANRPDLQVELFRGNVDTRLKKVEAGDVDAAILACAGLDRLGYEGRITQRLPTELMLPAIGQGCMAVESRYNDPIVGPLLAVLDHADTRTAVTAERELMAALGGSCRTPVGGYAHLQGEELWLRGLVGRPNGQQVISVTRHAPRGEAEQLGRVVAAELLGQGAESILSELQ